MADERHVTVLMVDLAGYTALTEAHGSTEAAHVVARYLALAAEAAAPGVRLVERVGDGLVFVADRAESAVQTALRLRALVERTPHFPRVRGGLHAGVVALDEDRYVGEALNVASRVTERARAGQILCTESVVRESGAVAGIVFRALGPVRFRHLVRSVAVYEVAVEVGGGEPLIDPVCRMQVDPVVDRVELTLERHRYVFCSIECRDAFADHPDDYVGR